MTKPAHRIVFANEKGGTGKSTTAVHVAVALAYRGAKVAAIDLDPRQRTLYRYFENRQETAARRAIDLPTARFEVLEGGSAEELEAVVAPLSEGCDFIVFDTPGRDDPLARHAATEADTLVTPLNDSFVDFDLIGQVDAETFKVRKLSFYAELIWEARLKRSRRISSSTLTRAACANLRTSAAAAENSAGFGASGGAARPASSSTRRQARWTNLAAPWTPASVQITSPSGGESERTTQRAVSAP